MEWSLLCIYSRILRETLLNEKRQPIGPPVHSIYSSYKTNDGDMAYIRIYANGQRLTVYMDSGTVDQIAVPTIRKNEVSTFSFWVYKDTARNFVLDMKIELDKTKNDGSTKSIVDTVLGYHFGNIVGSSKEDSNINLTN
jgi:hypothetical protein